MYGDVNLMLWLFGVMGVNVLIGVTERGEQLRSVRNPSHPSFP